MPFDPTHLLWAVWLGILSAISLPLGSAVGLRLQPRPSITAILAAFGAGALIAALTIELVAPTVEALGEEHHGGAAVLEFWTLLAGALAGGITFVVLDRVLAKRGAYLRKISTSITWFTQRQKDRHAAMLKDLCAIPLLRRLPSEQVGLLIHDVHPRTFSAGEQLFAEGDESDELFFVRSGEIELQRAGQTIAAIGAGGFFGELAILTQQPRTATARCKTAADTFLLRRDDIERWRTECPEFDRGLREIASQRLAEIRERDERKSEEERIWGQRAIAALQEGARVPTNAELRQAAETHEGAGLAVWLGMLIDGIPESIAIGVGLLGILTSRIAMGDEVAFFDVVPYTLIAGLLLSNFPEALSSSVAMQAQGWSTVRVLSMWSALVVVTAIGAGIGFAIGEIVPHHLLVGIEGVAAGAMLTAIASTMIPEAVHLATSAGHVGLATLVGFLSAISFKLLE